MKKFMSAALLSAVAVVCGLFCGCGEDEDKPILKMACEATFRPYEFRDKDNNICGVDVDLMDAVAKKLGRKLVVIDMPFDAVIAAAVTGKCDAAAAGITITEDRKKQVDFSIPYVEAAQVIIVPLNSKITKAADLKDKKIGVQDGTTSADYVAENFQAPERYTNSALAVTAMIAGKIDAVVCDSEPAMALAKQNEGKVKILPEPLTKEEYAVAFKKGNKELLDATNAVIAEMKQNGKLKALFAKYEEKKDEKAEEKK